MTTEYHLPQGFQFAGLNCGIKVNRSDMGFILSEPPCATAGVVTQSRSRAACTDRSADLLPSDKIRALIVLSGNANALTGPEGKANDQELAARTAETFGLQTHEVVTACTGIIGVPMPMDLVRQGIDQIPSHLGAEGIRFAEAIRTTDTNHKVSSREITIDGKVVRIFGAAKGSGMIHPGMATMLCFLTTDLKASSAQLQPILKQAVDRSFNRISVDRDVSTNDAVILMANGASGAGGTQSTELPVEFVDAVESICRDLAIAIARDGEGATRLLESTVMGAPDEASAAKLARSVTESNLFKAALFSGDPNWGRALAALGAAATGMDEVSDPTEATLKLQGVTVYDNGPQKDYDEDELRRLMQAQDVQLEIQLSGDGTGQATAWGCDLSYDYVAINADIAASLASDDDGGIARTNEVERLSPHMRHDLLVDCLSHIQRFQGLTAVVRIIGEVAENEDLRESFVRDILLLRSAGLRPIIVHGGGLEVARRMDEHGTPLKLMNGIPTPSGEAAQVLEETLVGRVNKDLVSLVQRLGGQAVGLSGKDGDLIRAKRATLSGGSTAGTIERVDAGVVGVLDNANYLPVVAAIGVDHEGETVTLSADSVASELAISLNAGKLIYVADAPGIADDGKLITSLNENSAGELLKTGGLGDGSSRRLNAGLRAFTNHVRRVHFIDGRVPHSIIGELFTSSGVGTMLS